MGQIKEKNYNRQKIFLMNIFTLFISRKLKKKKIENKLQSQDHSNKEVILSKIACNEGN